MTSLSSDPSSMRDIFSAPTGHLYEAWVCEFLLESDTTLLSGGDDSRLKMWDIRSGQKSVASYKFDLGVTSVFFPNSEQVYVGSYDDCVHVLDVRKLGSELCSVNMGGGVWRFRSHEGRSEVSAALMYGGVSVWDTSNWVRRCERKPEGSLAYGLASFKRGSRFFSAFSFFYDRRLDVVEVVFD